MAPGELRVPTVYALALRGCPFCGCTPRLERHACLEESVRIGCGNDRCPVRPSTEYLLECYLADLHAAWNHRA